MFPAEVSIIIGEEGYYWAIGLRTCLPSSLCTLFSFDNYFDCLFKFTMLRQTLYSPTGP